MYFLKSSTSAAEGFDALDAAKTRSAREMHVTSVPGGRGMGESKFASFCSTDSDSNTNDVLFFRGARAVDAAEVVLEVVATYVAAVVAEAEPTADPWLDLFCENCTPDLLESSESSGLTDESP